MYVYIYICIYNPPPKKNILLIHLIMCQLCFTVTVWKIKEALDMNPKKAAIKSVSIRRNTMQKLPQQKKNTGGTHFTLAVLIPKKYYSEQLLFRTYNAIKYG